MKKCFKCGETKSRTEFYKHPAMSDGLLGKCKSCAKSDVHENYASRRNRYAKYEQEREQRPERRANKTVYQRRHRENNPEKYRARLAVSNALRSGKLVRKPCRVCGGKAQAHHADYSKPLEVDWLCFKDHRELEHGQVVSR